jgi:guanylate kinase
MKPATTQRTGILLLVSGPSGSGKTTLCRRLADEGEAVYSISCTTRQAREGERDGHDYHFLPPEAFAQKVANDEFLEHAEVHGHCYGTLKSEVISHLAAGTDVVIDIDVQGADQIRACEDPAIRAALVDLFVMPPTEEELRTRLTGRGSDSRDVIELRMKNALEEIRSWPKYQYRLLSGDREQDYAHFKAVITAERLKVARLGPAED